MKNLLLLFTLFALVIGCGPKAPEPLTPVKNLVASDEFALKVKLTWSASPGATGYTIYRTLRNPSGTDPEKMTYDKIGTSEIADYEDFDVISGSLYYYKVEAFRNGETAPQSDGVLGETVRITPERAFDELADATDGKKYDAPRARDVPGIIVQIVEENAKTGTDLVFLIDNTYSMADDISEVKKSLTNIISRLPANTRLGIATYNDSYYDPTNWYKWSDLSTDFTATRTFLDQVRVYGGGDLPESVYDGMYETITRMSWNSSAKRMMIVIGDAEPLEATNRTKYGADDVIKKAKSMGLVLNLYPILIED